jgi:hypothetical protein
VVLPKPSLGVLLAAAFGGVALLAALAARPTAQEGRTPTVFLAACDALSRASLDAFSDLAQPLLDMLTVGRDDFAAYCRGRGLPLPPFWFARGVGPSSARAAAGCRRWLLREAAGGRKRQVKGGYWAEAKILFPGLSERSFDAIWEETVPASWKRAGRPSPAPRGGTRAARRRRAD